MVRMGLCMKEKYQIAFLGLLELNSGRSTSDRDEYVNQYNQLYLRLQHRYLYAFLYHPILLVCIINHYKTAYL